MPVVVEPVVTEEKLRALLAEQTESPSLDFKRECDLSNPKAKIEFIKDVGAMMPLGGFIVIGADSNGQPVGWPADEQAPRFDEAPLRQQAESYLQGPLDIRCAPHTIDGHRYVLVYIGPHRDHPFAPFKKDGKYPVGDGKTEKTVFTKGQVYVRRGTSSIAIQHEDVPGVLKRYADEIRESAREEFAKTVAEIVRNQGATDIARGSIEGVTWQLDEETFYMVTLELLRQKDYIPLHRAMLAATADLTAAVTADDADTVNTILDRVITAAAAAVTYDDHQAFTYALDALAGAYRTGFERGYTRTTPGLRPEQLWLDIVGRVEALGALAVRVGRWTYVREIADQPPHGRDPRYYRSWIRHASVDASRAGLLGNRSGSDTDERTIGNLISLARHHISRLPALRPDRPDDGPWDPAQQHADRASDVLLTSACVFDAAWCVIAQANSDKPDASTSDFFTDFAYYDEHRTLPFFDRLVTDDALRYALLPDVPDRRVAATLGIVLRMADTRENWYDFDQSDAVKAFIEQSGR